MQLVDELVREKNIYISTAEGELKLLLWKFVQSYGPPGRKKKGKVR